VPIPLAWPAIERHAGRNELAMRSASRPIGSVLTIESLMPRAEFLRTTFYQECMRPQGLYSLINLRAARGEHGAVANFCVLRTGPEGDFDAEDIEVFSRLAPHLRRAVMVHARLAEAEGDRRALAECPRGVGALDRPRRRGNSRPAAVQRLAGQGRAGSIRRLETRRCARPARQRRVRA